MRKFCLLSLAGAGYGLLVTPHRVTGFDSLNIRADNRTFSVMRLFYVRIQPSYAPIMVGRDGGAFALAGFVYAGLSTLLRLTTPFDSGLVRLSNLIHEAATMVATPTHPCFIWRFFGCQQSTYHTVTARTESEARALLPATRMLFAARLPSRENNHD